MAANASMPFLNAAPSNASGQGVGKRIGGKRFGKGKLFPKRYGGVKKDYMQGFTKPAIRRNCRRGGIKRISLTYYDETRASAKAWLQKILQDALAYCEHARRKTVTSADIMHSLVRNKQKLYI